MPLRATHRPGIWRRRGLLTSVGLAWGQPLRAQTAPYPNHPIRVVVPFAPGGGGDIWGRFVVAGMSGELGQPMPVENRPGAGGMLGSEHVARSAPDGYTLLYTISALFQAPVILRRFPYDPVNDFAPIGRFGLAGQFFVVGPAVPAAISTLHDFLHWAREQEVRLGSNGPGGTAHALIAMLARETGPRTTIAQYRSETLQVPDIIGGRLHGGFQSTVVTPELVKAGQARALAIIGEQRAPTLPEVPTFLELGLSPRFAFAGFNGVFAPAATPEPILARLREAFRKVAQSPASQQWLQGMGVTPAYLDGPAFRAQIASDMRAWQEMVETLGIAGEL